MFSFENEKDKKTNKRQKDGKKHHWRKENLKYFLPDFAIMWSHISPPLVLSTGEFGRWDSYFDCKGGDCWMHLIQHDTQTGRQFNVNTDITSQHRKYPMKKLLHQRQFSISNKVIGMGDLFSVTAQKMVCNILCYVFFFLSSETIFLSVFLLHNKSTSKEKVHRILS